jgi:hypothetical protein
MGDFDHEQKVLERPDRSTCWLLSGLLITGEEALARIAGRWSTMEKRHRRPRSPETDEQCNFVRAPRPAAPR